MTPHHLPCPPCPSSSLLHCCVRLLTSLSFPILVPLQSRLRRGICPKRGSDCVLFLLKPSTVSLYCSEWKPSPKPQGLKDLPQACWPHLLWLFPCVTPSGDTGLHALHGTYQTLLTVPGLVPLRLHFPWSAPWWIPSWPSAQRSPSSGTVPHHSSYARTPQPSSLAQLSSFPDGSFGNYCLPIHPIILPRAGTS